MTDNTITIVLTPEEAAKALGEYALVKTGKKGARNSNVSFSIRHDGSFAEVEEVRITLGGAE